MIAVPFGGHPTLEQFIEYAISHGCKKGKEVILNDVSNGDQLRVNYLFGLKKQAVQLPILEDDEKYLSPSVVRSLCSQLGIPDYHS